MKKTSSKNFKSAFYAVAVVLLLTTGIFNFFSASAATEEISLGPVTVCAATE